MSKIFSLDSSVIFVIFAKNKFSDFVAIYDANQCCNMCYNLQCFSSWMELNATYVIWAMAFSAVCVTK